MRRISRWLASLVAPLAAAAAFGCADNDRSATGPTETGPDVGTAAPAQAAEPQAATAGMLAFRQVSGRAWPRHTTTSSCGMSHQPRQRC